MVENTIKVKKIKSIKRKEPEGHDWKDCSCPICSGPLDRDMSPCDECLKEIGVW